VTSGTAQTAEHVRNAIEALYRQEVLLLQSGRYQEWLSIFTEDVRYRAPIVRVADKREEVVAKDGDLAYFDEDLETLTLRVEKQASTMAWTEYPPSRVRYLIQVLAAEPVEGGEALVTSNFLIYQTRHDNHENFFFGERLDRVRAVGDSWKVAERRIVLDRSRLGAENLSIFF
jgi:3-phenylpropionate/cinnamic acid dioxygenase small subunit